MQKKEAAALAKKEAAEKRAAEKAAAKEAVNAEKEAIKAKHAADKLAAKADGKVLKRPAVCKRPAASQISLDDLPPNIRKIDMTDVFVKLRKRKKEAGMTRNKFVNNASDAGKRRAKAAGATWEQERGFAGIQYREAAKIWDK